MHTILVTGGAGFIGSNFVRWALGRPEANCKLVVLDKLTYAGNLENLAGLEETYPDHYFFVRGDICDGDTVAELFEKHAPNAVLNFAAESHVDRSILDPMEFVRTNVLGTATLLAAARRHWPEESWDRARFLQISTDEVYGSLPEDRPDIKFTEDTPLAPHSPYSASKASADLLTQAYHDTYGFPTLITRCSNNYGPYQFPEKLIPLVIRNAMNDESVPVYGDGKNVRDWLYVSDHCTALWDVLSTGEPGSVYNIGGDRELRNIDLIRMLLDILDKPHSLIEFVNDRPGHDRRYAIDAGKLKSELGWEPSSDFREKLAETVNWYREHTEWLERVISGEYLATYDRIYRRGWKE